MNRPPRDTHSTRTHAHAHAYAHAPLQAAAAADGYETLVSQEGDEKVKTNQLEHLLSKAQQYSEFIRNSQQQAEKSFDEHAAKARAKAAEAMEAAEEAMYAGRSIYTNLNGYVEVKYRPGMQCLETERDGKLVWVCI